MCDIIGVKIIRVVFVIVVGFVFYRFTFTQVLLARALLETKVHIGGLF